jgi:ribosomal protein S8E
VFERDGLSFVADTRALGFLDGLTLDVQVCFGREAVVASHPDYGGCC